MMSCGDVEELKGKQLCFHCTGEDYLRGEIKKAGARSKCDYCGKTRACFSLEELAERVEQAFKVHYVRTTNEPDIYQWMMIRDRESNYDWEREGEPTADAIMNAADIPEEAAREIQIILDDRHSDFDSAAMGEETAFSDNAYYEEKGASHGEWESEWKRFERSLTSEARFFNQHAADHLRTLFEAVDALTTRDRAKHRCPEGFGTSIYDNRLGDRDSCRQSGNIHD